MGLKDFFKNLVSDTKEELQEVEQVDEGSQEPQEEQHAKSEYEKKPLPYKFCGKNCNGNNYSSPRCQECIEKQKEFETLIYEIEILEETIDYTPAELKEINAKHASLNCRVCGAPMERGYRECPYCGQAYDYAVSTMQVPESKIDRIRQYNDHIQKTWDKLVESKTLMNDINREAENIGLFKSAYKVFSKIGLAGPGFYKQSVNDIKQGALHYEIPVSLYISGVITGEYSSPRSLSIQDAIVKGANAYTQAQMDNMVVGRRK